MNYQPYLAVLRRRVLLVILITVFGAGSAGIFALRQPRIYQATVTLLINPAAPNQAIPYLQAALSAGSQSQIEQLASTYDVFLTSDSFDQRIIEVLHLAESPSQIAARIKTDLVGTTNFYRISATAGTRQDAQQLANTIATQFIAANLTVLQGTSSGAAKLVPPSEVLQRLVKEISDVSALDQRLIASPNADSARVQAQIAAVETRLSALSTSYNQLAAQANTASTANVNTATLTSPAVLPENPISPTVNKDVLLGGAGGLSIGLILAFLLEFLEYTIRTPEQLEEATGLAPIAVIAAVETDRKAREATGPGENLFTLANPRSPVSEAFRTLRTNLAFSALGNPARTLVVCSVLPGEGKSTVASNLAIVLAQSGKRVVLVDADLRRPSLHVIFGVGKANGLTDLLINAGDLGGSLRPTSVPNLRLLPSGTIPPNPAELLSSDAMKPLITALKNHADIVIFDSPPLGALTDAVVLSTLVEGTLMVVRAGLARPNVVKRGLETLRKVGARPLGIVLNHVVVSQLRDYSYYYYYAQGGKYHDEPDSDPVRPQTAGHAGS